LIPAPPRAGSACGLFLLPLVCFEFFDDRGDFLERGTEQVVLGSSTHRLARMLLELVQNYEHWPELPETATATEARAALADLRQLQGYFAALGMEQEVASLKNADARLALLAARDAAELSRMADEMEQALAESS